MESIPQQQYESCSNYCENSLLLTHPRPGHKRRSILVLEGRITPSLTTLLNDSEVGIEASVETSHEESDKSQDPCCMHDNTVNTTKIPTTLEQRNLRDPSRLMNDITQCRDQVEELIQLFSVLSSRQEIQRQTPDPPRTHKVMESRIPRRRTTNTTVRDSEIVPLRMKRQQENIHSRRKQLSNGRARDLECARVNLEQSLKDAMRVLDQFPKGKSNTCGIKEKNTNGYLKETNRNCLLKENVNAFSPTLTTTSTMDYPFSSLTGNGNLHSEDEDSFLPPPARDCVIMESDEEREEKDIDKQPHSLHESSLGLEEMSRREKLSILDEAVSLMSKTNSSPTQEQVQQLTQLILPASCPENPPKLDLLVESCPSLTFSKPNSPTYRVLFPDPILHAPMERVPSQSLSGIEPILPARVQPKVERDAMSDYEETYSYYAEGWKPCRRTKSALSVLMPTPASFQSVEKSHQRSASVEASSDWDLIEGGISVRDGQNRLLESKRGLPGASRGGNNAGFEASLPSRVFQEEVFMSSNLLSRLNSDPYHHQNCLEISNGSLLSEFSSPKGARRISPLRPPPPSGRVDQSVQCDLCSGPSAKHIRDFQAGGCASGWFRKKKQTTKKRPMTHMIITPNFLSHAISDGTNSSSLSLEHRNGMLCGIQRAMKAAFRSSRQHKQD